MDIPTYLRIGVGAREPITSTELHAPAVALTSDWAGSYHIRAMDEHFHDYVEHRFFPPLPPRPGFPSPAPYTQLTQKLSAPSVSANIGEAIAAEWAVQARPRRAPRNRPRLPHTTGRAKAPDYLMRFERRLADLISAALRQPFPAALAEALDDSPDWWPVESKARERNSSYGAAYEEALIQLAAYWWQLRYSAPAEVGYGAIVILTTVDVQDIYVSVLVPRQQAGLLEDLRDADRASELVEGRQLRANIQRRMYGL